MSRKWVSSLQKHNDIQFTLNVAICHIPLLRQILREMNWGHSSQNGVLGAVLLVLTPQEHMHHSPDLEVLSLELDSSGT